MIISKIIDQNGLNNYTTDNIAVTQAESIAVEIEKLYKIFDQIITKEEIRNLKINEIL
jgi:hypothetical protein